MNPHDPSDLEWQRRYEQNDTPWDKGAAAPPLVGYLRAHAISGRVIVPGCGRGHEARALAAQADCSVLGLDLSTTAIKEAQVMDAILGKNSSLNYEAGDFFHLGQNLHATFDWVVEHTCFCAINPAQRTDYVKGAVEALRPRGKLFAIFYLSPDTDIGPPFAISSAELSDLFDPHFRLLQEWVPNESFPGRENRERIRILERR